MSDHATPTNEHPAQPKQPKEDYLAPAQYSFVLGYELDRLRSTRNDAKNELESLLGTMRAHLDQMERYLNAGNFSMISTLGNFGYTADLIASQAQRLRLANDTIQVVLDGLSSQRAMWEHPNPHRR